MLKVLMHKELKRNVDGDKGPTAFSTEIDNEHRDLVNIFLQWEQKVSY